MQFQYNSWPKWAFFSKLAQLVGRVFDQIHQHGLWMLPVEKDLDIGLFGLFCSGKLLENEWRLLGPHFEGGCQLPSQIVLFEVGWSTSQGPGDVGGGPPFTLNVVPSVSITHLGDVGHAASRPKCIQVNEKEWIWEKSALVQQSWKPAFVPFYAVNCSISRPQIPWKCSLLPCKSSVALMQKLNALTYDGARVGSEF